MSLLLSIANNLAAGSIVVHCQSKDAASAQKGEGKKKGVNIILMGPVGAGKGTQAAVLTDRYNSCHLSTGDMLRDEVAIGSELGKKLKQLMDKGVLVPDDLVCKLIEVHLTRPDCLEGFILDGFPRTMPQAKQLQEMLDRRHRKLDAVVQLTMDEEQLLRRVTGRLVHPDSGRTYHEEFKPPKKPMKDDVTGEPLIRRSDDNAETLRLRMASLREHVAPLLDHYKKQGLLTTIDASQPIEQVSRQLCQQLDQRIGRPARGRIQMLWDRLSGATS